MNLDLFDGMDGYIMRDIFPPVHQDNISKPQPEQISSDSRFPERTPLAMAYVPFQQWREVYSEDDALRKGTLFPQLDLPFKRGGDNNE